MKLNKKYIFSWCLFDFANSTYSAIIVSVIFPVYYANIIVGNESGQGDLWWGRAISLSMVIVSLSSPFLGGIADYSGIRKRLLFIYTVISLIAIAGFSFLHKGMILEGFLLAILANIGVEGGIVFYNGFLPHIAPKEYQGRVSAWGFGVGYGGSILSLILALPLAKRGEFNAIWLMVVLLFSLFSIPAFVFLPPDIKGKHSLTQAGLLGLKYVFKTLKEIWNKRETKKFLISYMIYEDGINTVIVFSSIFAATTLAFRMEELIILYLLVQVTALIGAFIIAKPTDIWGPKNIIIITLIIWTIVVTLAFFIQTKLEFLAIASLAGFSLGAVQSSTRAFYLQFIPKGKECEYFGVYSFVGKSSAIIGPLIFGYLSYIFGSQRPATLSIASLFLIGMIILQSVRGGKPNVN
jgi:UMF1 family MFS transporter